MIRIVTNSDNQLHKEIKSVSKKPNLVAQCNKMECRVNPILNLGSDVGISYDILKHRDLNWQDVAGLQWMSDEG
ncbi:MAG: hypothetical protein KC444_00360 [Nitrosopumilus sp.]|nr:hypothetical protein [Nitrosopumilus sp.]